jgi:hypothetical protein
VRERERRVNFSSACSFEFFGPARETLVVGPKDVVNLSPNPILKLKKSR